jgi:uncharacterized membrane protein YdjX (TVP38/TMEM64 family)
MTDPSDRQSRTRWPLGRWLPLAMLLLVSAVVLGMGWHRHVSFETLVRHHHAIHEFIGANWAAAVVAYAAIYVTVVALALPGGLVMTLIGGVLFGGAVGGAVAVVSATLGAVIIFLIARSAFGEHLVRRAGPRVAKLADGFRAEAFHYLLFLRLVPLFPFFLVNLVPALAGVRLATFVAATFIGIIPAGFAFAYVAAGLDSTIRAQGVSYNACLAAGRSDCRLEFDIHAAVTPELLAALTALGVVALLPVIVKRLRARRRVAKPSG